METVNIAAVSGADNITVGDMTGTGVKQVNIDLAGSAGGNTGDGLTDTVVINGTAGSDVITLSMRDGALVVGGLSEEVVIKNFDPNDAIHIAGLGGDDVIDASALGAGGPQITLDGGEGDDVLIGSAGNETLLGAGGDDVLRGNGGVDVLDGGPGNNVVIPGFAAPAENTSASQGDIFALGQVTIEDFEGSQSGAANAGSTDDLHGMTGVPDFGVEEQSASVHVEDTSSHPDGYLL
jgi:Ca2+-binding RTX toxin-like protein